MFTRFYRPPEVILGHTHYDFKSDIWSIGCTMAECVRLTDKYRKVHGPNLNDRFLFPGGSCFPMSPDKKAISKTVLSRKKDKRGGIDISGNDQLIKIIKVLGELEETDLSFIENEEARTYSLLVNDGLESKCASLKEHFNLSSPVIHQLL